MNWKTLLSIQGLREKQEPGASSRSAFERDYDRIIFSHPFRRLQDKTQVHPLPEHDFVHTRLTHSLEVSSVARSLGRSAGEKILERNKELSDFTFFDFGAIAAAAALAHDLGNPPFGHAGEAALSDFFLHQPEGNALEEKVTKEEWKDLLSFEGNAQGFRILNKNQYGLKLTCATLGAFTKYPCASYFPARNNDKKSQKKFGFFQTEKEIFERLAAHLELPKQGEAWARHPLAFLVEAADDICYSIIDLEDGCRLGLISFSETTELFAGVLKEKFDAQKLQRYTNLNEKLGVLRGTVIKQLIDEATTVFLDHERDILQGNFDEALTDVSPSKDALQEILKISFEKIYRTRQVVEIEASGHEALPCLVKEFIKAGFYLTGKNNSRKYENLSLLLPEDIRLNIVQNPTPYLVIRHVMDFISSLTDRHALSLYRLIRG